MCRRPRPAIGFSRCRTGPDSQRCLGAQSPCRHQSSSSGVLLPAANWPRFLRHLARRLPCWSGSDHILGSEDQAVSEIVTQAFENRGIRIITGIDGIQQIETQGSNQVLRFTQNGQIHQLQAQAVMLSTGWVGNLASLNLPAAGVETQGAYIPVNDYLQTNQPHIFAAGDITGRMMLVQSAGYEALAAAENAVLGVGQPQKHPIVPHGGFTDPEYASVGLTEAQAQAAGDYLVAQVDYRELDRAVIDGRTDGLV